MLTGARGRRAQGVSLLEVLVATAIGAIVLAAALALYAQQARQARNDMLAAQLNQDLRAVGDLLARDLRRAAYWHAAAAEGAEAAGNPQAAVTLSAGRGTLELRYGRADADGERALGIRLAGGVVQMLQGDAGWQPVTDPGSLQVTALAIEPRTAVRPLGHLCRPACSTAEPTCPRLVTRTIDLALQARPAVPSSLQRTWRQTVRLRNDEIRAPACPAALPA